MKIAALVSVVAAGRQARDAQLLFEQMLGDQNNNVQEKTFFSETQRLFDMLEYYLYVSVKVQDKKEYRNY